MTNAFKNAIMMPPGIVAPTGNTNGYEDAVDLAVEVLGSVSGGDVCSHVLAYIRAKMWVGGSLTSGLVDRKGNPISSGTYAVDATKNVTDAAFNNQATIDLSPLNGLGTSENSPFQMGPGLRLNGAQAGMTPSFTVVATIDAPTAPSGGVANLFGSTDGLWGYLNASGTLAFRPDGSTQTNIVGFATPGTPCLCWYSWDNSAKILRTGLNSATVANAVPNAGTYSPSGTGKIQPFGYTGFNQGNCLSGKFEGMLVLDKAYMNGAVAGDDQLFTSLIAAWAALI